MQDNHGVQEGGYRIRSCFLGPPYPPSSLPIDALKPISLSDLRLETHHAGGVLIVRRLTSAVRITSVPAGIEDDAGEVGNVALYNADPKMKAAQVMPKGTVFAMKEPLFKAGSSGGYIVRVGKGISPAASATAMTS